MHCTRVWTHGWQCAKWQCTLPVREGPKGMTAPPLPSCHLHTCTALQGTPPTHPQAGVTPQYPQAGLTPQYPLAAVTPRVHPRGQDSPPSAHMGRATK